MNMSLNKLSGSLVAVCVLVLAIGVSVHFAALQGAIAEEKPAAARPVPQMVEADMHHFMEYLFEPAYLRLQESMAAAPADNAGWKAIKGDSLLLAEASNLLFARVPKKDAAAWKQIAADVRALGASLYAGAKKKDKDYPAARGSYEAMIHRCNACHEQFHKGKPVLKP
jgi:hypothetical protein